MILFLLLASLVHAQSLQQRVDALEIRVKGIESGRQTLTGLLSFPNGIIVGQNGLVVGGTTITASAIDLLASTNTKTAAQTFVSSVTLAAGVYTSTATTAVSSRTVTAGALVGGWQIVASTNPSSAGIVRFTGLEDGRIYRMRWYYKQLTGGAGTHIRFNDDSTATAYNWAVKGHDAGNNDRSGGAASDSECQMTTVDVLVNEYADGEFEFRTLADDATDVMGKGYQGFVGGGGETTVTMSCKYGGTNRLVTISLRSDNGNPIRGFVYLEQLIAPLP